MRNNTFCENTRLTMHKFQQSYLSLEMSTKHNPKFTSERLVLPKTCPSTITLTFPPLKYTAMFQKLLFSDIKMSCSIPLKVDKAKKKTDICIYQLAQFYNQLILNTWCQN